MLAASCRTCTHPAILSHQWLSSRSVVQTERPAAEEHHVHDSSVGRPALAFAAGLCALGSRSAATHKLLSALRASHHAKAKLTGSRVPRKSLPFAVTGKRDENEEEDDEEESEEWWEDDEEDDAAAGKKDKSQPFSPDEANIADVVFAESQQQKQKQKKKEPLEPESAVVEVEATSTSRVEVSEEEEEDFEWWEDEEGESKAPEQEAEQSGQSSQPEVYEAEVLEAEPTVELADGLEGLAWNYDKLAWRQTANNEGIDVQILPPESIGDWVGRDVNVDARPNSLVIRIKEQPILSIQLFGATKPDENYWDIETDRETKRQALIVHLAKMDTRMPWPALEKELDFPTEPEASAAGSSAPDAAESSSEPIAPELIEAFQLWKAEGRPMDELKALLVDPETGMTEEKVSSLLQRMEEEENQSVARADDEKKAAGGGGQEDTVTDLALRIVSEALEKANRQLV